MRRMHALAVSLVGLGIAAVASQSQAQPTPKFPFDASLVKPLGFRVSPGLNTPHVIPTLNYLQPPTRIRVVNATGPLWQANTFCQVEYAGKSGYLRCDDASAFNIVPAVAPVVLGKVVLPASVSSGETPFKGRNGYGLSCVTSGSTAMADCSDYCAKACDPVPTSTGPGAWEGWNCPRVQKSGDGLLAESSSNLKNLRSEVGASEVEIPGDARGTADVIGGLKRLDTWVRTTATAAEKAKYRIRVSNCWRDGAKESAKECGFVVRGINPQEKGLAWPGANPHSAGNGCDIVVVDVATRRAMFDFKVDPKEATPEVRAASRYLDKAITAAGGRRLTYETWHYEWNGPTGASRCTFPDCDSYWPPKGRP